MIDNVEKFIERVNKMTSTRSRELRLTYEEAHLLSCSISQLLCKKITELSEDSSLQIIGKPLSER